MRTKDKTLGVQVVCYAATNVCKEATTKCDRYKLGYVNVHWLKLYRAHRHASPPESKAWSPSALSPWHPRKSAASSMRM